MMNFASVTMLAVRDKESAERLADIGSAALGGTPEEFAAAIAADVSPWGAAVRSASIELK